MKSNSPFLIDDSMICVGTPIEHLKNKKQKAKNVPIMCHDAHVRFIQFDTSQFIGPRKYFVTHLHGLTVDPTNVYTCASFEHDLTNIMRIQKLTP